MRIVALADDMTGALEVGAKFSVFGAATIVSTKPILADSADIVVFDTETRHLGADAAGHEVQRFVTESRAVCARLIYKKTDSTLRGNISAELEALARVFPEWRIGYAPAYPALGRTVRSGLLYVDGVQVHETAFARDALNPISTSRIAALLQPELACTIFDGEADSDLADATRQLLSDEGMRIAAGPAGFAEMIARELAGSDARPPVLPLIETCLILNGSRHELSAVQMGDAADSGWRILARLHAVGASAAEVAKANAEFVVQQVAAEAPDAIFIIGGDTAFSVVRTLGLPLLHPIAEVVPGVPVTRIRVADLAPCLPARTSDLFLITKAGGFGRPDVIARVRARLKNDE